MNKLQNILVPIDFSKVADNALQYAIKVAEQTNARLIIYHVYHVPTFEQISANGKDPEQEVQEQIQAKIHRLLKESNADQIDTEVVTVMGLAGDEIKEVPQKRPIDLIIMGTHGASGIKGKLLGSITADIMVNAKASVLAIPSTARFQPIKRIAFAFDYGKIDHYEELETLMEFSRAFGAEVHIVKVNTKDQVSTVDESASVVQFEQHLDGIKRTYHLTVDDTVEKGLENYVKEHNIDVLALMPRKHSIFERLFRGSTSRQMVQNSKIPVFGFHGA